MKAKIACDENGPATDHETEGDPFCHGNDDDCVDDTVARPPKEPTGKTEKCYIHCNLEFMILTPITISNAAHGKVIGVPFDGCKVGEFPLFGVNLVHGVEKNGPPVLPNLAVKPFHEHVPDGTLNI